MGVGLRSHPLAKGTLGVRPIWKGGRQRWTARADDMVMSSLPIRAPGFAVGPIVGMSDQLGTDRVLQNVVPLRHHPLLTPNSVIKSIRLPAKF